MRYRTGRIYAGSSGLAYGITRRFLPYYRDPALYYACSYRFSARLCYR